MSNKKFELVPTEIGLKCDNEKCDWHDSTVTIDELPKWLNVPCPKCGENVLTKNDYENFKAVQFAVDFYNSLSDEQRAKLEASAVIPEGLKEHIGKEAKISVSTHGEIKFNIELQ